MTSARSKSFTQRRISYTDRGQLVGHIVIGVQMLGDSHRGVRAIRRAKSSHWICDCSWNT